MHRAHIDPRFLLFLILALPLLLPLTATAQGPLQGGKVGEWAEYQINGTDGGTHQMRRSIVAKEGASIWVETKTTKGRRVSIMKVLFDQETGKPKRLIVKNAPEPAMEMPVDMWGQTEGKSAAQRDPKLKPTVTKETIQVPAGAFPCTHIRDSQSPATEGVWSSDKVPAGGIVQSRTAEQTMVLTAFGHSGAKSEITETPQKMPSMKEMMKGGKPSRSPRTVEEQEEE